MKTLEEKIAEVTEKHNKEVENLRKEKELVALLPICPARVFFSGSLGVWVTYTAATLKDALCILDNFALIPMIIAKNGVTTVKPERLFKPEELGAYKSTEEYLYALDVEKTNYAGIKNTLEAWATVGNYVIRIQVNVSAPPVRVKTRYSNPRNINSRRVVDHQVPAEMYIADKYIKWYSGDRHSARFTAYYADRCNLIAELGVNVEY